MGEEATGRLDGVFAALSDPTRRAILQRLTLGDASVAQLAEPFAISQPAVSKHLKVLEHAGLISRAQVATARYSHLEADALREASAYVERYRRFWSESFDRLDTALADHLAEQGFADPDTSRPDSPRPDTSRPETPRPDSARPEKKEDER
jgi:DNA-binding transcriptional ArsR family regulator